MVADFVRLGVIVVGFNTTVILTCLRPIFHQLPFHPVGFVYCTGMGIVILGSWSSSGLSDNFFRW